MCRTPAWVLESVQARVVAGVRGQRGRERDVVRGPPGPHGGQHRGEPGARDPGR